MDPVVAFVADELARLADPAKAEAMARYMKTTDPFYGVQKPARVPILEAVLARFPAADRASYQAQVAALWARPHREEKYLALAVAAAYPDFITFDALALYRRLIVEGAWWDLVDDVAARCVGRVWKEQRDRTTPVMARWIDDPDRWLRRTALIGQLKHRDQTDQALLFDFCLRRAHDTDFFIRKAIGWALREYAKTSPAAVLSFTEAHRADLSGLSFREATKHLSS